MWSYPSCKWALANKLREPCSSNAKALLPSSKAHSKWFNFWWTWHLSWVYNELTAARVHQQQFSLQTSLKEILDFQAPMSLNLWTRSMPRRNHRQRKHHWPWQTNLLSSLLLLKRSFWVIDVIESKRNQWKSHFPGFIILYFCPWLVRETAL